ncbi:MAG: sulfatase-like hydrolase/transferase [Prevotellaceae bacterium]|nr:lipid A phosphoethanolamine transferase [Prevotella sp.]MDD7256838.1 sulfatase-like hydrolase/transferase [Prevotellaceae bacterium]
MRMLKAAERLLDLFFAPMKHHGAFFIFMYALGLVCTYTVVPNIKGAHAYRLAPQELFFDVYLLCIVLTVLPGKISKWVRRAFYVLAYVVAIIDVYCFVKFDSTLTPTMLLLVGETNSREAGEFLSSFLTADLIFSNLGWVLAALLTHIVWSVCRALARRWKRVRGWLAALPRISTAHPLMRRAQSIAGAVLLGLLVASGTECWPNKVAVHRLMSYNNIGEVEHELTQKGKGQLYQPLYRLAFSIYANRLTAKQVDKLIAGIDKVKVDSCTYHSPNIVLIIGESYNRHHAQLYGYDKNTTPRQSQRAKRGELIPYSDVIAPWNLTSFVFKQLFSLHTVGDSGEWCDYPLFPELFRKAGYHVTFLTNQYLPQAKEAVYDFSGGFFLNNPQLSNAMFDTRNERLHYFDEGLLKEYDRLKGKRKDRNLTIFHLKGQHVDYRTRCPKSQQHLTKDDYNRPKLSDKEKQILAYYDNAILYNDSIVNQIISRFENEDAVVIYVPDHGEECFDGDIHFYCRMHGTEITARLAREEFDIPFWIYCSRTYRANHPETFSRIVQAKDRKYMTDALPHLLLHLAGIHAKEYRDELNLLSPNYRENRPRVMKNTTDYDKLGVKP